MTVENVIRERGISEVVHFTTSHGCLGTLYGSNLLSRAKLHNDEMVKYLFSPNAELRRDVDYLDHISLSIEHINTKFYNTCSQSWHRAQPIFWCILAFDPEVLTHEGVVFSTTNNMYTGVIQEEGAAGLNSLYADTVVRWATSHVRRPTDERLSYPTCFQAEALYPQALSTEHLRRIYVRTQQDQNEVCGFLKATFHPEVDVLVSAEKFGARPK